MTVEAPGSKWDRRKDTFRRLALAAVLVAVAGGALGSFDLIPRTVAIVAVAGGVAGAFGFGTLHLLSERLAGKPSVSI